MKNAWINVHLYTMDDENHVFENGGILYEDATIIALGEADKIKALAEKQGATINDGKGRYLFPGLINSHTHLYQELTKGRGSDLGLNDWFSYSMAPIGTVLRDRHIIAGTKIGIVEAIRSGVTTIADYMQHQPVEGLGIAELEVVKEMGVRMVYGRGYRDIGKKEVVETSKHIFDDVDALKKAYEGDGMINIWLAPAAGWGVTEELIKNTRDYSVSESTPIMMHLFETGEDEKGAMERFNKHAIDWYEESGILNENLLAVHSVALGEKELAKYKEHKVMVSYNPVSNMYLASGVAPISKLLESKLIVSLGTDGAGSNNSNDFLETIKFGALLQKVSNKDPLALTGEKIIKMATYVGAESLKIDNLVGSLEAGKKADFFIYAPEKSAKSAPVFDGVSMLVYSGDQRAVDTVVINGKTILSDGEFVDIDEEKTIFEAIESAKDLMNCLDEA